ncbi:MAG: NTP transferase domain-containing protein [Nitrospira sp.]|nr:NTP transferase domain-containing protein [Nitrospira sp.]
MKAIVLVGGRGTRLRPLTFAIPKPLLAVGDKPILQSIIEQLKVAGCDEIVLATGYLGQLIEAFCGDGSRFGVHITYVEEPRPLGTAGPVSLVRDRIGKDEFFILMNGDIVTRVDFRKLVDFACQHDYGLTIGYVNHVYKSPFGVLTISGDEIIEIAEKPEMHHCVSSGIYVLKGSALDLIPDGDFFTIPDLVKRFRLGDRPVGAYFIKEFWRGIEELGHLEQVRGILGGQLEDT